VQDANRAPQVAQLINAMRKHVDVVVHAVDAHPENHISFAAANESPTALRPEDVRVVSFTAPEVRLMVVKPNRLWGAGCGRSRGGGAYLPAGR
jgi:nicotinamidase-related amidase